MAWSKNMLTAVYVLSFEAYIFERMRLRFNLSDVVKTFDTFNHHNGVSLVWYFRTSKNSRGNAVFYVFSDFENNG
jgi:hypothetical protein